MLCGRMLSVSFLHLGKYTPDLRLSTGKALILIQLLVSQKKQVPNSVPCKVEELRPRGVCPSARSASENVASPSG